MDDFALLPVAAIAAHNHPARQAHTQGARSMSTRFASAERFNDITQVREAYREAVAILEVEGGCMVFATEDAFERCRRQRKAFA